MERSETAAVEGEHIERAAAGKRGGERARWLVKRKTWRSAGRRACSSAGQFTTNRIARSSITIWSVGGCPCSFSSSIASGSTFAIGVELEGGVGEVRIGMREEGGERGEGRRERG
eukprot:scaffold74335_cov26-Tisochrysis_lutea.AAC.2